MVTGHPIEILSKWVASEDGLSLYQRLIRDFQTAHATEQLALTLVALICYKRLLPYCLTDSTQSIRGCYLLDFDVLIKGRVLSNERAVFERMLFSLLRVLKTFGDDFRNICELLAIVLKTHPPILHRFDGFSDAYWAYRMGRLTHEKAFENINISDIMDYVVTLHAEDEEGWGVVGCPN